MIIVSELLFFLPIKTILLGALLGLVVLAYFLTIHFIKWESVFHKELMIAVVYCTGLIITPLSSEASSMHWENIFMLSPMFLLVMANLLLFAQKDISFDEASNFPSASQSIGYKTTAKIIQVIWLLFLTNLSFLLLYENIGITIIYSLMFMMLFMISKFDRYPFVELHFRHIGDGVFLIPALYFLL